MKQTTRSIVVRASSSDEVVNFYTKNLLRSGWSMPKIVQREGKSRVIRVEKNLRHCVISVEPLEDVGLFRSMAYCQEMLE